MKLSEVRKVSSVVQKLVSIDWADRDRAYSLFMSYAETSALSYQQILRLVESKVPQHKEAV